MSLFARRANLIQQINAIKDEQTIEILEETLSFHLHSNDKDITDGLNKYQLQELSGRMEEPAEKDTISEEEFRKLFARWNTR